MTEILVQTEADIGTVLLNRPSRRNALTPSLLEQLTDALGELRDVVRVAVIAGAGHEAFSAGYDVGSIATDRSPVEVAERMDQHPLHRAIQAIQAFPAPVIARMRGVALGAGLDLAMACDLRVAAAGTRLGMTPAKLGVLYHWRGLRRAVDLVGLGRAKEIFLTGRVFDADRAERMGLVNWVVSADELEAFTATLAAEIAQNAPLCVSGLKVVLNMVGAKHELDGRDREEVVRVTALCYGSEDLREGQKAFLEKRKPQFRGR